MKKLVIMAILAVAMVSVSSAYTSKSRSTVADEPVKTDTVKTDCKANCPEKTAADTVKAAPQDTTKTAK